MEDGVDADVIVGVDDGREIHRLAVDEDQFHFGVRDAQRLDEVFDGLWFGEGVGQSVLPHLRRQKVV